MEHTHIIKHPNVEDYFIDLKPSDTFQGYYDRYGDDLMQWYETGRILIMDDTPISADYDLLRGIVSPYGDRVFKKLKTTTILASPLNRDVRQLFNGNLDRIKSFQDEVRRIHDLIISGIKEMFPKYEVLNESATWRFSVTHTEGLHLDVYKQKVSSHFLRVFWNVDSYPRIWHCGHHLNTILKNPSIKVAPFKHPEDLNKQISLQYLGRSDCHTVLFAPKSMWFAHSQYLPHEIVFGRRSVGFSIEVDPKSMLNPGLCFGKIRYRNVCS